MGLYFEDKEEIMKFFVVCFLLLCSCLSSSQIKKFESPLIAKAQKCYEVVEFDGFLNERCEHFIYIKINDLDIKEFECNSSLFELLKVGKVYTFNCTTKCNLQ